MTLINKKSSSNETNSNYIRYILGILFFICSFFAVKGLGVIICLISAFLILPFSSNLLYKKFNLPKSLEIIMSIICFILALCIFPKDTTNSTETILQTNAICRINVKFGTAYGSETVFINNDGKNTTIEKKIEVSDLGTKLGEISVNALCGEETSNANNYSNAYTNCSAGDGNDINTKYTTKSNIEEIIDEYINNDYQCINYSNNKDNIIGNWCLEFDNNGNKNINHYIFYNNGYYTSKKVSGENGKFVTEDEGYYSFDGEKISEISFVKGKDFYGSAYEQYFTYDKENDTLINSNIKAEFPNVYTRCD